MLPKNNFDLGQFLFIFTSLIIIYIIYLYLYQKNQECFINNLDEVDKYNISIDEKIKLINNKIENINTDIILKKNNKNIANDEIKKLLNIIAILKSLKINKDNINKKEKNQNTNDIKELKSLINNLQNKVNNITLENKKFINKKEDKENKVNIYNLINSEDLEVLKLKNLKKNQNQSEDEDQLTYKKTIQAENIIKYYLVSFDFKYYNVNNLNLSQFIKNYRKNIELFSQSKKVYINSITNNDLLIIKTSVLFDNDNKANQFINKLKSTSPSLILNNNRINSKDIQITNIDKKIINNLPNKEDNIILNEDIEDDYISYEQDDPTPYINDKVVNNNNKIYHNPKDKKFKKLKKEANDKYIKPLKIPDVKSDKSLEILIQKNFKADNLRHLSIPLNSNQTDIDYILKEINKISEKKNIGNFNNSNLNSDIKDINKIINLRTINSNFINKEKLKEEDKYVEENSEVDQQQNVQINDIEPEKINLKQEEEFNNIKSLQQLNFPCSIM
jgi:hypothetical protein